MGFKQFIKNIVYGHRSSSARYAAHLRELGAHVGEGTFFYDPQNVWVDTTRAYLIDIGDHVQITRGVTILTHGYDWSVLKSQYGEVMGSAGRVKIGNNVFIGMNATILKGVTIGNNVIIGAGSLVNKDIPDNTVCAGNPCRVVMSIEDYYQKRKEIQEKEAVEMALQYHSVYGKWPDEDVMAEFFWLYKKRDEPLSTTEMRLMHLVGNEAESKRRFLQDPPKYNGLDDFIEMCKRCQNEKMPLPPQ